MTLGQKQKLFSKLLARLIDRAYEMGFELTLGEAWRPPELVALYAKDGRGSGSSVHPDRLAVDLNLFKNGVWQTNTEAHRPLGLWWKSLHPLCRWGGDFASRPDGNHYSLEHEGRA